jgi:hypothetical protein
MAQRIAGIIQLQVDGTVQNASGSFSYNLGEPKREAITNAAGQVVGYKEIPQTPFLEGEIIDDGTVDLKDLVKGKKLTVNLTLGSGGKMFVLHEAFFAGEGTGSTEDAKIPVRWEGQSAEEIKI